jgi:hypothetical protein
MIWERYVFYKNGACKHYGASPADSNWGPAIECHWKATTGKYSDTGKRWDGIEVDNANSDSNEFTWSDYTFSDSNTLIAMAVDHPAYKLKRRDAFPFSK